MKYAVEIGSGTIIYITKFHKGLFRHSKVRKEISRQHGEGVSLLLFFEKKKSMLKIGLHRVT
jgi:hypothetical protein